MVLGADAEPLAVREEAVEDGGAMTESPRTSARSPEPVLSVYPSRLLLRGEMGGGRSGGRPSPGEDTDREQNVAKDREPDTRLAGGEGDAGRKGNPVAIDVSI